MKLIKQTKNWLLSLRFLFRPMFVISLVLHGWLLNLPLPSASKPESKKPEEIKEKVQITRLIPPSSQSTSQTKPTPTPVKSPPRIKPTPSLPKITAPRQQIPQISSPSPQRKITPKPQNSSPKSSSQPPKKEAKPTPTPKASPSSQPSPKPSPSQPLPEAKIDNSAVANEAGSSLLEELRPRILKRLEQSTNDLAEMEKYLDSLPIQFIKDEQISFFLTEQEQLKSGVLGSLNIPQTNPTNAFFDYIEPVVKNELGFEITQLEPDYGNSILYQAKNSSNVVFYMSIVKLKGSGAFLVLWPDNPNKPQ
ncbi:hypothetical protein [Crocosphaera sp. UHCC 0190]|uniref:hypothetical protein n=1 Tax=Crocosphaera sp. UHCC 0190 TaxID=3110246 RepID=UPI002B215E1E|nr:hypothetical protein [Crocosphaera sp. UHCC 0190]